MNGQRVVVTGGGTGIGRAVAVALRHAGSQVVVCGRRREKLEEVAKGCGALPLVCDLEDRGQREGLLSRAKELMGGLDGLVHSAGTVLHQVPGHIDEAALRQQLEINLVAPLRLGEQALTELAPGGAVVFVTSTLAQRPVKTSAAYSAAKAGLLAAMKCLALEGAARQVRFNAVSPGVVDTELVRQVRLSPGELKPDAATEAARVDAQLEQLKSLHPLGRLGTGEDVAQAVLYLLQATWLTGSELVLDGGLLLRE